jgi:hypothetical protein
MHNGAHITSNKHNSRVALKSVAFHFSSVVIGHVMLAARVVLDDASSFAPYAIVDGVDRQRCAVWPTEASALVRRLRREWHAATMISPTPSPFAEIDAVCLAATSTPPQPTQWLTLTLPRNQSADDGECCDAAVGCIVERSVDVFVYYVGDCRRGTGHIVPRGTAPTYTSPAAAYDRLHVCVASLWLWAQPIEAFLLLHPPRSEAPSAAPPAPAPSPSTDTSAAAAAVSQRRRVFAFKESDALDAETTFPVALLRAWISLRVLALSGDVDSRIFDDLVAAATAAASSSPTSNIDAEDIERTVVTFMLAALARANAAAVGAYIDAECRLYEKRAPDDDATLVRSEMLAYADKRRKPRALSEPLASLASFAVARFCAAPASVLAPPQQRRYLGVAPMAHFVLRDDDDGA